MPILDNAMGDKPNPGSAEAVAQGCRCNVLDNKGGKFPPMPPDGWHVDPQCPVHEDLF